MALRIAMMGVDLGKLLAVFGSRSASALAAALQPLEEVAEEIAEDDPEEAREFRDQCTAILGRALNEGIPFEGLEREEQIHWEVARALVESVQTPSRTDAVDYHYVAWETLWLAVNPRLTPSARELLDALVHKGRPLFGRAFERGTLIYGYMTGAEVESLREGLVQTYRQSPPPFSPDEQQALPDQLIGWLAEAAGRGEDLWFYMI
jgi:hypothetical protein